MPGPVSRTRHDEPVAFELRLNLDLAGVGELDRVADQVHEHLHDPALVADRLRQAGGRLRVELETLLAREALERCDRGADRVGERKGARRRA